MEDKTPSSTTSGFGRTIGDVVVEGFHNWKPLMLFLLLLFLAFTLAIGIAGFFVLRDAAPGSQISFFGLQYTKASLPPPSPQIDASSPGSHPAIEPPSKSVDTRDYRYPSQLLMGPEETVPILDSSLAVFSYRDGSIGYARGALLGPNLRRIRIASRKTDGTVATLGTADTTRYLAFDVDSVLEMEYAGNYFELTYISVKTSPLVGKLSVKPVTSPTLLLLPVDSYRSKDDPVPQPLRNRLGQRPQAL